MIRVEKYGGTSVSSIEKIKQIANHLKDEVLKGNKVVVVFSAMGKTTNEFLDLIKQTSSNPCKREVDQLLVLGEMKSVALGALALNDIGVKSISVNANTIDIVAYADYNNALIKSINKEKITNLLSEYDVIFVTGFQGINHNKDYMALGRGGSDTTAVALAKVLDAPCYIYTDVDGVYAMDPRIIDNGIMYDKISYELMLEMASLGSGVLIPRSVSLAYENSINLYLLRTLKEEGTRIMSDFIESDNIIGISKIDNLYLVKVSKEIFTNQIIKTNIKLDMLNTIENQVFFVLSKDDLKKIEYLKDEIIVCSNKCKISIVGNAISSKANNLVRVLKILANNELEPSFVSTSEFAISFITNKEESIEIVKELAKEFEILKKI